MLTKPAYNSRLDPYSEANPTFGTWLNQYTNPRGTFTKTVARGIAKYAPKLTGSVPGGIAGKYGGPLVGTGITAAALGYLLGKLGGAYGESRGYDPDISKRVGQTGGAALAALLHLPSLLYSWKRTTGEDKNWLQRLNWDPMDVEMEKPQSFSGFNTTTGSWDTGALGFNPYVLPGGRGYGIPANYSRDRINEDPYLSPSQKAKAVGIIDRASDGGSGIVGWRQVARAAVDAGVGYAGGTVTAKVFDGVFGGLSPQTFSRIQDIGLAAGLIRGAMRMR